MPTFYHGTRRTDAVAMAGPPGTIDVTRGSGEFGRGFYTQNSKSNALTWAQNRFPGQGPCLLEVEIDDKEYTNLQIRVLSHKQAARLTQRLRNQGTLTTHVEGVDVVVGPLTGSRWIEQQKFESLNSQTLLNGPKTKTRIV
jgi:hypothetical protein